MPTQAELDAAKTAAENEVTEPAKDNKEPAAPEILSLTPEVEKDLKGMFDSTKRNLETAKAEKQTARAEREEAQRIRQEAKTEAETILAQAKAQAEESTKGFTAKQRAQFAKEMLDNGDWDKEQYNVYRQRHDLDKPVTTDDISAVVRQALREMKEAEQAEAQTGSQKSHEEAREIARTNREKFCEVIAKQINPENKPDGPDAEEVEIMLRREWRKDPDNFDPKKAAAGIIEKHKGGDNKQPQKDNSIGDDGLTKEQSADIERKRTGWARLLPK